MTRSRRYLEIGVGSKITSESLAARHAAPGGRVPGSCGRAARASSTRSSTRCSTGEDRCSILHNDGAEDFELVAVPPSDPQRRRDVLIPHRESTRLEDVDAFAGFVAVSYREDGLARVGLLSRDAEREDEIEEIEFDEPLFTAGLGGNPEWEQPTLRIGFTSMVTPSTVFDYAVDVAAPAAPEAAARAGRLRPAAVRAAPRVGDRRGRHADPDLARRIRAPCSASRERPAPMLLYGYGSYEASIDPSFSIARLSLLDRGVRVRDRARARRRRDGPALVRGGQDAREAEHLHRLRRRRPPPRRPRADTSRRAARRRGRLAPAAC